MDVLSFETEVRQLIGLQQEGEYWDFKKEWHQNKADLLHDIICMANNLSNQDGLIIIGVDEENDYSICDVINDPNRRKTQDIVSFLREKKFAGGIRPTAYVQPVTLWKKTIDIIVIRSNIDNLMKNDVGYEEYCRQENYVSPLEEYFARICASVLPHGEKTYQGIQLIDEALAQKKKTPAEYIAYDFDFFTIYNKNVKVQEKEMLLDEIKELALDLYENLMIKIRNIGNRYEKE